MSEATMALYQPTLIRTMSQYDAPGLADEFAHRRLILFFCPTPASSANQISTAAGSTPLLRATFAP
jgi:hypothetical protein